jgi:HD-GYP domain-containing protein (c-di-GMP phosphodiesterase class II)
MLLFWLIPSIPPLLQIVIDVFLLTLFVVPLTYWLAFLPMNTASNNLHITKQVLIGTQDQALSLLTGLAAARDDETGQHIVRTRIFVRTLAERLKEKGYYEDELNDDFIHILYKVAPLHDIGKVGIPDIILNKKGRLSEDERVIMKTHAAIGASILNTAKESFDADDGLMATAASVAWAHHEKWDGTGYPRGLKAYDIPLAARIMSLADMYDALTSDRPYKVAWSHEQAVQEVVRMKGVAFDPIIVDAFLLEEGHFKQIASDFNEN